MTSPAFHRFLTHRTAAMSLRQKLFIVWALLIVYTLPVFAATVVYIINLSTGFDIDYTRGFFRWLSVLSQNSDSQLNLFHKVLLPIVAGISTLSFSQSAPAVDQ